MMKRFMKKAAAVLMVAVVLAGVYAPEARAATSSVIVHAKDGEEWGKMSIYNFGDAGETAGVWPGTEMTAEADGWYTYTIETEVPLNLVFSAAGSPQSSNIEGLAADAGEVWVVIGGTVSIFRRYICPMCLLTISSIAALREGRSML